MALKEPKIYFQISTSTSLNGTKIKIQKSEP